MVSQNKVQGVIMLVLAAACFWLPQHMKRPGVADQKILVATDKLDGGAFDKAVVLVVQQNGYSAQGLVLNRPDGTGGPVEAGQVHTLHTLESRDAATVELAGIHLGYTEGADFPASFSARRPEAYVVLKGYAAWGFEQLGREINDGMWKVIDYDPALVFRTPPADMHTAAAARPAVIEYKD